MSERKDDPLDMTAMFETWMKSMGDMWSLMGDQRDRPQHPKPAGEKGTDKKTSGPRQTMAATLKNWQTMMKAMAAPESMAALIKGSGAVPDVLLKLIQTSTGSFMELQQNLVQHLGRLGSSVEAYRFEDLDENIFRLWTDIYEREFQRFFQIPQLGLMREYQEKAYVAADTFNVLQSNLAEFMRMLVLPFSRSAQVMQEKLMELAEKGELSEDSRVYYTMWVKVLEGHFMTLFQTPEYVEALTRTVDALADFAAARNAAMEDLVGMLPVVPQSEMDDMAREFHDMKKRMKQIEKELKRLRG
jgi:polyhydroxyalkanoate synthase subunit PhaE